ncbi:unnamed protein product [Ilex paraguariensis]|uniref:Protein kinase domain-containing protein n=1 Tax=Ilex paraguariensis TaxID=185542 RepID=A0ABC8TZA5_9AQUA
MVLFSIEMVVVEAAKEGSFKSKTRKFTFSEIVSINGDFETVIGRGGSGKVYHGHLKDGTQVAVKLLSPSSTQTKEFHAEVQLLMRIHHRNLATLLGYCYEGKNMALISEYMANGNVQQHLSEKTANVLSWKERVQIAVDAAQGVLTCRYYSTFKLNEKSDVYRFGIVLLELITGQPAITKETKVIHLVDRVNNIVDPRLRDFNINSAWKILETAMACVPTTATQRLNMSHVLMELKGGLAMEMTQGRSLRMESNDMGAGRSLELSPIDLEISMAPKSR